MQHHLFGGTSLRGPIATASRYTRRRLNLAASLTIAIASSALGQQRGRRRLVGLLLGRAAGDAEGAAYLAAIRTGLEQRGWTIGRDVDLDVQWIPSAGRYEQAVAESLERRPDLLVVNSSPYLRAVIGATRAVPVVFVAIADPLGQGFVRNLARPGGNMTGFGVEEPSMGGKWLEILREVAPALTSCAVVLNPATSPAARGFVEPIHRIGQQIGMQPIVESVGSDGDIARVFADAGRVGRRGAIVLPDSFLAARREAIVAFAATHRVPTVYYHRGFADEGGLVAFGIERVDLFRRAAEYVHQVLNGADPGSLPVQMPVKYELVVNLRAARSQGLDMPQSLLARADEVIE